MNSKVNRGNFFEHFTLNQNIVHATPRTITSGDVALYIALTGSRFLLSSSIEAAKSMGYSGQLVDDMLVFHLAFGKTVADISLNAIANLGYAEVSFLAPVYVGDTLNVESTVIGLRENKNKRSGIVYVQSSAYNQHQQKVLTWKRWVMVNKADPSAKCADDFVPVLKPMVDKDQLSIPAHIDFSKLDLSQTGSINVWDDYSLGERIDHRDGMTIDNSDHTLATKLYQNNARVHFDHLYMQNSTFKQRLMYGGHVISVCRALSFNGLANGVTIAAINGGSHIAPTFAKDTIYAFSMVLDKWQIPSRKDVGAIRIKTWGVKNAATETISSPPLDETHRFSAESGVVLELDYTLLFPKAL